LSRAILLKIFVLCYQQPTPQLVHPSTAKPLESRFGRHFSVLLHNRAAENPQKGRFITGSVRFDERVLWRYLWPLEGDQPCYLALGGYVAP
jgi:hypothetical protein